MQNKTPVNLYHEEIMALARSGKNAGTIADAPSAKKTNALCGDECVIAVRFAAPSGEGGEGGGAATVRESQMRIAEARHQTRGCVLCVAAAVKATTLAMQTGGGMPLCELLIGFQKMMRGEGAVLPELAIFTPVIPKKTRRTCVLLPFEALADVVCRH